MEGIVSNACERNTEEQLRAPGLRPEALCRSACVSDLNLNPALVRVKWAWPSEVGVAGVTYWLRPPHLSKGAAICG